MQSLMVFDGVNSRYTFVRRLGNSRLSKALISEKWHDWKYEIFTTLMTLDLSAGFWQLLLHHRAHQYMAFMVPSQGHYQWVTPPKGATRSHCQLSIIDGDHHPQAPKHHCVYQGLASPLWVPQRALLSLKQLLQHLIQHRLEVSLSGCHFWSQGVSFLGYQSTDGSIWLSSDVLWALREAFVMTSLHKVSQFLDLWKFFCPHI